MKKTFLPFAALLVVAVFGLTIFTFSSCKKTTNPNQEYIGTYDGILTSTVGGVASPTPDTLSIAAGSNNSAIVMTVSTSQTTTLNATVSGNNLTVPTQTISETVSGTTLAVIVSGTGTLTGGNTLSIALTDSVVGLGSGTLSYTGTK